MPSVRGHGEGTIYRHKATGLWCASISLPTGRRTVYCRKSDNTRKAAKALLGELLRQRDAGLERPNPRLTVAGLLSGWLADVIQVRPATRKHYRIIAETHLIPALGDVPLADLTPLQVQRYLNAKGKTHAAQSVRHHHAVLRNALQYAVRAGYVGRNVAALASPPSAPRPDRATLVASQLHRVAESGNRLVGLWLLAGVHGLRESEALGLLWEDVDLDAGTLGIRHQLARSGGRWVLVEPKTSLSRRTIQLAAPVVHVLTEHRERQLAEAAKALSWPFYRHVFLTPTGRPYHSAALLSEWYALLDRLNLEGKQTEPPIDPLPRVTFHGLRHSAATNAVALGIPLEDVKQMLGHSSIRLTSDTYSHPDPVRAREVARLLGEGFSARSAVGSAVVPIADEGRES
jgi:integrase